MTCAYAARSYARTRDGPPCAMTATATPAICRWRTERRMKTVKRIKSTEALVASSARQGVTICGTEAEIVLAYIKVHGYELLTDDDYKLYLHDESAG